MKDVLDILSSLIRLDIDAASAYSQAIDNIEPTEIHRQMVRFRGDHDRHVAELSELVRALGGEPPERKKDFKGFLIEGMTAIRSMAGTVGALKAMRTNERLTHRLYERALADQSLTENARALVRKNRDDEQRHLDYIEAILTRQPWATREQRAV